LDQQNLISRNLVFCEQCPPIDLWKEWRSKLSRRFSRDRAFQRNRPFADGRSTRSASYDATEKTRGRTTQGGHSAHAADRDDAADLSGGGNARESPFANRRYQARFIGASGTSCQP